MADEDRDKEEVMSRHMHALPRLPIFSGDAKDTSYDLWSFEVKCLQSEGRAEADIKLAIRRSLKGQASRSLMSLGTAASVQDILAKFSATFGPTESISTVLSTFYSLRQREGEDAGSFANRLEDCLYQAQQLGRVSAANSPAMLREAFEAGLRPQTRVAVGYLFSSSNLAFEVLVKEVKRIERELNLSTPTAVRSVQDTQIEQLTAQVAQLKTELQNLKQHRPQQPSAPLAQPRPSKGKRGYSAPRVPAPPGNYGQPRVGPPFQHQFRQENPGSPYQQAGAAAYQQPPQGPSGIWCWNCGQEGHTKKGCRQPKNMFLNPGQPLNLRQPVPPANPQAYQYPAWWGGQQ